MDERRNRLKTILTRFKEQNKQHFEKQTQIGITLNKLKINCFVIYYYTDKKFCKDIQ